MRKRAPALPADIAWPDPFIDLIYNLSVGQRACGAGGGRAGEKPPLCGGGGKVPGTDQEIPRLKKLRRRRHQLWPGFTNTTAPSAVARRRPARPRQFSSPVYSRPRAFQQGGKRMAAVARRGQPQRRFPRSDRTRQAGGGNQTEPRPRLSVLGLVPQVSRRLGRGRRSVCARAWRAERTFRTCNSRWATCYSLWGRTARRRPYLENARRLDPNDPRPPAALEQLRKEELSPFW